MVDTRVDRDTVLGANAGFYAAIETGDLDLMASLWWAHHASPVLDGVVES